MPARVAVTLRLVLGLTVADIARAFLIPETTVAQRITRAKGKIKAAHIPYRVPNGRELRDRVAGVLTVIYLVFNEGYLAGSAAQPVRLDLTQEAIRLGRLLRELLPEEGEATGLLALMILSDARRRARVSATGELVTLREQDRTLWDREQISEGHDLVRHCIATHAAGGPAPGRFQLLAAINAVHTYADTASQTDWPQILTLYDRLLGIDPSPVARLNRHVALAEVQGARPALDLVEALAGELDGYHAFHATRADLLRRLGRTDEAVEAYARAAALTANSAENVYLARRSAELTSG